MQYVLLYALFLIVVGITGCRSAPTSPDCPTQVQTEPRTVDGTSAAAGATARDKVAEIWTQVGISEITDDAGRTVGFVSAARSYHRSADTAITRRLDTLCGELNSAGFWTAVDEWLTDPKVRQRVMGYGDLVTSPKLQPRSLLEIAMIAAWKFHRRPLSEGAEAASASADFARAWQLLGLVAHEPNVLTYVSARRTTILFLWHCVTTQATAPLENAVTRNIIHALDSYPWPLLDTDAQLIAHHKTEMLAEIDQSAHPDAAEAASRYFDDLTAAIAMPEPHRWQRVYQLADYALRPEMTGVPEATCLSAGVFANRRLPAALAQLLRHVLATRDFENLTGRLPQSIDDLRAASAESRWMNRATGPGVVSLVAAPDGQAITLSIDGIVDPDGGRRIDLATAEDRDLNRDADIRITVTRSQTPR